MHDVNLFTGPFVNENLLLIHIYTHQSLYPYSGTGTGVGNKRNKQQGCVPTSKSLLCSQLYHAEEHLKERQDKDTESRKVPRESV